MSEVNPIFTTNTARILPRHKRRNLMMKKLEDRFPGAFVTVIDVDGHPFFTIGIHAPTPASIASAKAHFREMMKGPEEPQPTDDDLAFLEAACEAEDARMSRGGSFFRNVARSYPTIMGVTPWP
jgi:hypothetical protein